MQMKKKSIYLPFFEPDLRVSQPEPLCHKTEKMIFVVILLSVFAFLLTVQSSAQAQIFFHVRSGAVGSNNGSDWNNAFPSLPSTLVRGAIYYIADGSYGSYTCDDPDSGSSYITIRKATGSNHGTETGWVSSYGDGTAIFEGFTITTSYWIIDGATRGLDWKTSYGIEINTSSTHGKGLRISSGSYIMVRYVFFRGGGPDGASYSNDLVYTVSSGSNLTVQYCYFYNAGRCHFLIRNTANSTVEYCYFYLNESTAEQHSESFSAASGCNNWTIRYNIFDTTQGTGILMVGQAGGWKVHGNIFYKYQSASNGIFAGWTAEYMESGEFYNNSIIDCNVARIGFTNDKNIVAKNNLFVGNTYVGFSGQNVHDYNAFSGSNGYGEANAQTGVTSSIFKNYAGKDFRLSVNTITGDSSIVTIFNTDLDGNLRGASGVWSRGAFQFVVEGEKPRSPLGFRVISN